MDLSLDHPLFNIEKPLAKICKPLISHTPFDYFCYERFYHDGNYLAFCLDSEYCYEIFKNRLLPDLSELQKNNSHYIYLSPELFLPNQDLYRMMFSKVAENISMSTQYNIRHRLCITFNTPQYVEVFAFGLTKNNCAIKTADIIGIFINHIDLLEKFCVYFREKSKSLIEQNKHAAIKFDNELHANDFENLDFKDSDSYKSFLKEIKLDKYSLQGKYTQSMLSSREFECLLLSVKDKTAKQIGRLLSLSPRTVEDYLSNIKNKLGCKSKFELIDLAFNDPVIKAFIE